MGALKALSRNPMGTTTLCTRRYMSTLLHHTCIAPPTPPPSNFKSNQASSSRTKSPSSKTTVPEIDPLTTQAALEATRVLANALVLHPSAREQLTQLDGGMLLSRAMQAGSEGGKQIDADRLFLLGRVGFLMTVDRAEVVREMVDSEDVVESLAEVNPL